MESALNGRVPFPRSHWPIGCCGSTIWESGSSSSSTLFARSVCLDMGSQWIFSFSQRRTHPYCILLDIYPKSSGPWRYELGKDPVTKLQLPARSQQAPEASVPHDSVLSPMLLLLSICT